MELDENLIQEFTEEVDDKLDGRITEVILFGSYARGEAVPGSDVDLLIVLEDRKQGDQSKVSEVAGRYFLEKDLLISPKIISKEELEDKKDYGFFQEIRTEGEQIYG